MSLNPTFDGRAADRAESAAADQHLTTVVDARGAGDTVRLPEGGDWLRAEFTQVGDDLVLTLGDGTSLVVAGYFEGTAPPTLVLGADGVLPGDLVSHLAGAAEPVQYAELGAGAVAAPPIGRVTEVTGEVIAVQADGTVVTLALDDPVYQGDVIETGEGAALAITFVDETVFSLGQSARMVMDSFVFDPTTHDGASMVSVLEGVFMFVSGEVAASNPDAMMVRTPVMTIGVRGTSVAGESGAEGGLNTVVLLPDPGGISVGAVVVQTFGGADAGEPPIVLDTAYAAASATSAFDAVTPFDVSASQVAVMVAQLSDALPATESVQAVLSFEGYAELMAAIAPAAAAPAGPVTSDPGAGDPADGGAEGPGVDTVRVVLQSGDDLVYRIASSDPAAGGPTAFDEIAEVYDFEADELGVDPVVPDNDDVVVPLADDGGVAEASGLVPTIVGTDGNDILIGTDGPDIIDGRGGNDLLIGGFGTDILIGGSGADTFFFGSTAEGVFVETAELLREPVFFEVQRSFALVKQEPSFVEVLDVAVEPQTEPDQILDFEAIDTLAFDAFSFGFEPGEQLIEGRTFFTIEGYDGTNADAGRGTPHFVFDPTTNTLHHDFDAAAGGYTTLVTVQEGAVIGPANIALDGEALA